MSEKQIEANRRNAQRSTGPRTVNGRAVSSQNAVKHGILSREVLVQGRVYCESSREFGALHRRFVNELQPVGPTEEMLVDQILTAHWRLRRALKAEAGEIALSVDEGEWDRRRHPEPVVQWGLWEQFGDPIRNMERSAFGNRLLLSLLSEMRASMEREGALTQAALEKMLKVFGGKPNQLTAEVERFLATLQENPEGLDAESLQARNKQRALTFLDRKLRFVGWDQALCEERETKLEEAKQAAAVLPASATLDKIGRYEAMLRRQIERALNQLERLQRVRNGEVVPAPLAIC